MPISAVKISRSWCLDLSCQLHAPLKEMTICWPLSFRDLRSVSLKTHWSGESSGATNFSVIMGRSYQMWIATIGAVRTDSASVKKSSFPLVPLDNSEFIADAGTADRDACVPAAGYR
jgi:hypothetical protein